MPNLLDIPEREIGEYYKSRWAVGRAQRMPVHKLWDRTDDRLSQHRKVTDNYRFMRATSPLQAIWLSVLSESR